ncbi:MAG: hypothetical protein J6T88_02660 [Bacteroidales bacterium]|nr:hypothetical protein [Bacteroidales bacterium]
MKNISIPKWATYGILFIASFLFVFLFSCTTSPLYEHYPFWFHDDSGIFQEMGVCLLQGGTPYIDLFDHKGPILWFLQAFGLWISPHWGLMVVQSIFLFFTLTVWYKSTQLLTERLIISIIIPIFGLFFLLAFYERGNLCEEWSLPIISLPIYLYLKRWKTDPNSKQPIFNHTDTFIMGLCVGTIAMIRLNNTAPIIGFALWHFVRCIQQKEYKKMWTDIALIICGMTIIFVLCTIFYLIKAGWTGVYEMIFGTFIYNALYINDISKLPFYKYLSRYFMPIVFIIISIICLLHKKSSKNVGLPLAISLIVTLIAIGHFEFFHYMMIFIPLFIIAVGYIIHTTTRLAYFLLGLIIIYSIKIGYDAIDHLVFRLRGKQADTVINDGFHRFIESIASEERNSIYNAGLNHMGAGMYVNENIYQCNRFIYNHFDISDHLREYAESHEIKDIKPVWVLTQGPRPETPDEYLATHYTLADSIPGGQFDPIWCWKRNY